MHFLLLCILSSTAIFVIFKTISRFNIPALPVIVINYLVATLLGFIIYTGDTGPASILGSRWLPISIMIGIMFILMFFLVAYSTRKAGLSVTTVASKMSVIFPIIFSLAIDPSDQLTLLKSAAVIIALGGVVLTVYRPDNEIPERSVIFIPLLLFIGMGVVDSMVKLAQQQYVSDKETALFSAILFLNAFISGIVSIIFYRKHNSYFFKGAVWGWGLLLGAVNFGSIFFLVRALNYNPAAGKSMDSSVIFGANNISIVALSVLVGLLVFKEKLKFINWIGIVLSAMALLLFTQV
ncbi:MAG: DMT family transporter [Bacteroidales bacterium]|nr:DMT family transporter [Bacteroidales bacterium]